MKMFSSAESRTEEWKFVDNWSTWSWQCKVRQVLVPEADVEYTSVIVKVFWLQPSALKVTNV